MDKDKVLDEIFNDDPLGLLTIKPKTSNVRTADEHLLASFEEINKFVQENSDEPKATTNTSEFMLYARLKGLREDPVKIAQLKEHDIYNLLTPVDIDHISEGTVEYAKPKEIASIDDLLGDDLLGILDTDTEGLFDFKHTPKDYERAQADFVARRKPCKDFDKYEHLFIEVQKELAAGKRKLIDFKQGNLKEKSYYVHNGILFYLEQINISHKEYVREDGTRVREDGRTRCIFENGTESNMLKRSVDKILYANGRVVTENIDKVNEGFIEEFGAITEEDEEAGYIYVLKSKSKDEKIASVQNLYKIGYSKTEVEERIKNAEKQPTYLMAPVTIMGVWKGYNMNPQKLEQLLHNFFGNSCLNVDVFDDKGIRHTPQEWFIAPIEVIEQAIELIINGKIVNYKFDAENMSIVGR
ncbi:MAG: GIY-YIG nuclease family protein [Dysgonamonadaceae bacterium]|nr:GIY-YIG nuclease family protein [Dysgonamonadaceae bacterium]